MFNKKGLYKCAEQIRDCCQYYRNNEDTNYCHGCPFFDDGLKGCILTDSWYNEIDNPGDWYLDE